MELSRRAFTASTLGLALGSQLGGVAFAQASPGLPGALAAIRAYGERHRSYWNLPALTLSLSTGQGLTEVMHFGFANAEARSPITDDTLFQIGSITKMMTAAVIHQFVAEARLRLSDRFSDLLPAAALPAGNAITVQHLLDHVAGLPSDAPDFPDGGLWTGFAPGTHWHYSNTGYDLLGMLAEHVGAKPLHALLEQRIFAPLGMTRTRGAILSTERTLYAQGYEAADQLVPFVRGVPLAPTAWVDVTFAAGCVASTASDMTRFMRALADAVQGRGALGLSPQAAKMFSTHAVASDSPDMSYGNGLMHVTNGPRAYLHHTGGMPSFSSSMHVDVASGIGAFASSSISAFADYRPRTLTRFAVDAIGNALAGKPLPPTPRLDTPLANPQAFVGHYSGPAGSFEVRRGAGLTIVADSRSEDLQYVGGNLFRTLHPTFRRFTLMFNPSSSGIKTASWGPNSYLRAGAGGTLPASDPVLAKLAGHYVNDNPWWVGLGTVIERGGRLWMGTETPMVRMSDNLWRVGDESWSPERASFANLVEGRPQTLIYSGEKFDRRDI